MEKETEATVSVCFVSKLPLDLRAVLSIVDDTFILVGHALLVLVWSDPFTT